MNNAAFIKTIKEFHALHRRDLEWRRNITPYRIVVSEIMLQQTQVSRTAVTFPVFVKKFPDFGVLASQAAADVLAVWQGMGYNRRALYLKKIAEKVQTEFSGKLPTDPHILESFPGIGHATARSIVTFAFNKPTVFIETNIRRVFIHFFFHKNETVSDKQIYPLVESTLDKTNPREWYFALMDYGSLLSKIVENPNRRSAHYTKQSAFEGSARKVRGEILRILLTKRSMSKNQLKKIINDDRFDKIATGLIREGFIKEDDTIYTIV